MEQQPISEGYLLAVAFPSSEWTSIFGDDEDNLVPPFTNPKDSAARTAGKGGLQQRNKQLQLGKPQHTLEEVKELDLSNRELTDEAIDPRLFERMTSLISLDLSYNRTSPTIFYSPFITCAAKSRYGRTYSRYYSRHDEAQL
jgi:hypothetical protein